MARNHLYVYIYYRWGKSQNDDQLLEMGTSVVIVMVVGRMEFGLVIRFFFLKKTQRGYVRR